MDHRNTLSAYFGIETTLHLTKYGRKITDIALRPRAAAVLPFHQPYSSLADILTLQAQAILTPPGLLRLDSTNSLIFNSPKINTSHLKKI